LIGAPCPVALEALDNRLQAPHVPGDLEIGTIRRQQERRRIPILALHRLGEKPGPFNRSVCVVHGCTQLGFCPSKKVSKLRL